jgi:hypothetical protein
MARVSFRASWPSQCSDKIRLPIVAWFMQEHKGLGAVQYRFSARMIKQQAKGAIKNNGNSDASNAYWMVSENHGGAPAFVR